MYTLATTYYVDNTKNVYKNKKWVKMFAKNKKNGYNNIQEAVLWGILIM